MNIELLSAGHRSKYEEFLAVSSESLLYHTLRYRDLLLALIPEAEPRYWVLRDGDDIVGALPSMALNGPFGEVVNSLPWFGSHGDVIGTTPAHRALLREHWAEQVGRAAAATLISNPWSDDDQLPVEHTLTDERIGQITTLEALQTHDDLMTSIDGSARRNVRKAISAGVRIRRDEAAWPLLAELHIENMQAIGGNAKSPEFFEATPRIFRPEADYDIFVADIGGDDVAALLVMYFKESVEYFVPATRLEFRSAQPMALILAEAMVASARRGFRRWNWGGTWRSQDGVWRFKRKWGAVDLAYPYWTVVNDRRLLKEHADRLAACYPGFYVVPYEALEKESAS